MNTNTNSNWDISFGLTQNPEKISAELVFHAQEGSKVVDMDVHPSKPGLFATAHVDGRVCVWNYASKTAVTKFSLSNYEEKYGRKAGDIRKIRFYDNHVVERKDRLWNYGDKDKQRAQHDEDWQFASWLIVVAESHIVFFDYVTLASRELQLSVLDGKPASCIELTPYPHIIAFGGLDGQVRLFDTVKWKRVERLQSNSSKPILLLVSSKDEKGRDCFTAVNEDGRLYSWEWDHNAIDASDNTSGDSKKGAIKAIPSKSPKKAHDSFVACTYNPVDKDIITLGSDKSWMLYDITIEAEKLRCRSANKAWSLVEPFHHPRFPGFNLLVSGKGDSKIYLTAADPSATQKEVVDIAPLCASSKETRIRRLWVDQYQSNKLWVLTKTDIFVFNIEALSAPQYALAATSKQQDEPSVYCLAPNNVVKWIDLHNKLLKDIQLKISDGTDIFSSSTGRFVTIYSRESFHFSVFDTKNWKVAAEGIAKSFAWYSADTDRYAILEIYVPKVEEDPKKKRLKFFESKKKETPNLQTFLRLFDISSGSPQPIRIENQTLPEGEARELYSGAILGIAVAEKPTVPLSSPSPSLGAVDVPLNALPTLFTFWRETDKSETPLIPVPKLVIWDRSTSPKYVVLAFTSHFCVFKVRPSFELVARLNFCIQSGLWWNDTLFFATEDEIRFFVPTAATFESGSFALASIDGVEIDSVATNHYDLPLQERIGGPLSLVSIVKDTLYALDNKKQFQEYSLNCPALKFYILAGVGMVTEALAWAALVPHQFHAKLARYLVILGHTEKGLNLEGLSPWKRLHLAVEYSLPEDAARILHSIYVDIIQVDLHNHPLAPRLLDYALAVAHLAHRAGKEKALHTALKIANKLHSKATLYSAALNAMKQEGLTDLISSLNEEKLADEAKWVAFLGDVNSFEEHLENNDAVPDLVTFEPGTRDELLPKWNELLQDRYGGPVAVRPPSTKKDSAA